MFINKLHENSNSSKMSSYINLFLKTEITCIPKLLQNYLGNYYSNALCNGATWVFVLWCVLHVLFDKIIDVFLRKLRYKEYVRIRLKNCLWYLGFYGTALVYCGAALAQNEMELFNFKKMHVPSSNIFPTQVILGYTLISTFYLHSSLWEGLTKGSFVRMFSYLFLFALLVSSYILRIVETSFTLTALIGIAQVAIEFTRCCFMLSNQDTLISKLVVGMLYFVTFAIYVALYIIVIPLTFIVPIGLKLMSDYPNILLLFLFINMVLWLITEVYQSILFKFVDHWFYHEDVSKEEHLFQCCGGLLECSLFKPRNDDSFNLQILREEIKSRETKMMSMRKPKNKSMLIQTLKCMVAIKRKLNEKRLSDSSDSDDSEKSEDSDLRTSENTDEDTGELHSDQDEESNNEESESQESVIEAKKVKVEELEPGEFNKNKRYNTKEPERENIDSSKLDYYNDTDQCNIEALNIKPEESDKNRSDSTKKPEDEQLEFSKADNDRCSVNVKSMEESNIKLDESVENKCDNTKECNDENINFKPDNSKDTDKYKVNVKSIEESNVKSEDPSESKCDITKEPGDENIDFSKLRTTNDKGTGIDVKLIEKSKLKMNKEDANQVSEKAHSSESEYNVITLVHVKDDAKNDDKKTDLKGEKVKESDAATSRPGNTE